MVNGPGDKEGLLEAGLLFVINKTTKLLASELGNAIILLTKCLTGLILFIFIHSTSKLAETHFSLLNRSVSQLFEDPTNFILLFMEILLELHD